MRRGLKAAGTERFAHPVRSHEAPFAILGAGFEELEVLGILRAGVDHRAAGQRQISGGEEAVEKPLLFTPFLNLCESAYEGARRLRRQSF